MIFDKLSRAFFRLGPRKHRAEKAREELRANAEKALRMRRENDTGTHIPPHRTAHEGLTRPNQGVPSEARSREADFNTQMGRSAGARAGDAS